MKKDVIEKAIKKIKDDCTMLYTKDDVLNILKEISNENEK